MPTALVYSDGYFANIGDHVFPIEKYRLVYQQLKQRGILGHRHVEPEAASKDDLLLVHEAAYVEDLLQARFTSRTASSELPISPEIVAASLLTTGGTIRACEQAFKNGCALNLSGGFHHAFPDHAEGFCYINDMAVAIRKVQQQRKGLKAA
ncbi:MAG: histone deacetylase, partial [Deltaproteobacteria bacterium]|nr:histone deacetylase [Deltaproteobacteria bacterium]